MDFLQIHDLSAVPVPGDRLVAAAPGKVLLTGDAAAPELPCVGGAESGLFLVGELFGKRVWLSKVPEPLPPGTRLFELRPVLPSLAEPVARAVSAALTLSHWLSRTRFCGACGAKTELAKDERAARCPACGQLFYPTPSPAVIVAVEKEGRLLLAHNKGFIPGRFSTIAGFVDPGETLEDAVRRELMEEVGISVSEVEYVTSQGWPFPNSLMAAFRAKWKSGELRPDGKEIVEAGWFAPEKLPDIPLPGTVARLLIDSWLSARRTHPVSGC